MKIQQLQYLLSLNKERCKLALANILVSQVNLFEKALKIEDKKKRLIYLVRNIEEISTGAKLPKIEEVDEFLVLSDELLRLFRLEEKIDNLGWEVKEVKSLIEKLTKKLLEEIDT